MKRIFLASFFVLGLTSLISQLVIIREAIISFYGNELFIGLVLGFWLIWAAVGSLLLSKLLANKDSLGILCVCHFLIPFALLGEVVLLRLARIFLISPGQVPNLLTSISYLFVVSAPICLIFGLHFAVASQALNKNYETGFSVLQRLLNWLKSRIFSKSQNIAFLVSRGYFYETLGLILGGILYTLTLVFVTAINIVLLLAIVNFFLLFLLTPDKKSRFIAIGFTILSLIILATSLPTDLENFSSSWRFPYQQLVATKNSLHGNIAVTRIGNQYNFYESGLLVGSTQETFFNEELVHFPMLYHQEPKDILLIGGGFSGALNEILKYPVDSVYYLELDPQLINLTQRYLPSEILAAQKDPKVKIVFTDAKSFIKTTPQNFDLVIVNLPNPSTALLNRFYTAEFFREVRNKLKAGGLISLHLSSLANYLSPELENLTASIYKTLAQNYSKVIVLPEDILSYVASDNQLSYDPAPLLQRFGRYNLKNQLVTKDYLVYRLTNDRVKQALDRFEANNAKNNSNLQPIGYWYQILYWLSSLHPRLASFVEFLSRISLKTIIISFLILFFFIFWLADVLIKKKEKILAVATVIPEFSLLTAEITFIFLFQIIYGHLYYQLSLILTVIFLAMALGVWVANFLIYKNKVNYRYLFRLYFFISIYFVALAVVLASRLAILEQKIIFYSFVFVIGFLVGIEFPWVNKFYLEAKIDPDKKTGIIYGADLIGSSLGAILASVFLIPVLGVIQTIIFLAFLNFLAFFALFFLRQYFLES